MDPKERTKHLLRIGEERKSLSNQELVARDLLFCCQRRQREARKQLVEQLERRGEAEAAVAGTLALLASLEGELAEAVKFLALVREHSDD